MRVLIVEDDRDLAAALDHILQRAGYEVDVVHDGEEGMAYGESDLYDVIIFDVMLPKMDGFDAVEAIRKRGIATPVLMLTARGALPDRIEGLDRGADSYMTKPFSPQELLARLRALTRRHVTETQEVLSVGDLTLDADTHALICNAESIQLKNKEFLLAQLFLEHPGALLSRAQLGQAAWPGDGQVEVNNIEAYISMLRKKLQFLGSRMRIATERNMGYRLVETQEDDGNEEGSPC